MIMKHTDIFKKEKFSIRKFNTGTFSVLLGSTLFMAAAPASADDTTTEPVATLVDPATDGTGEVDPKDNNETPKPAEDNALDNKEVLKNMLVEVPDTQKQAEYLYSSEEIRALYDAAATNAQKVFADPNATQAQITEAINNLSSARTNLNGVKPNIAEFVQLVNPTIVKNVSTSGLFGVSGGADQAAYEKIITDAGKMIQEDQPIGQIYYKFEYPKAGFTQELQEKVNEYTKEVLAAMDKIYKANLGGLVQAVSSVVRVMDSDHYQNATESKKQAYYDAYKAAVDFLNTNQQPGKQKEIDELTRNVLVAYDALDGVKKDKLRDAINQADENRKKPAYYNGTDVPKRLYDHAIDRGKDVLDNKASNQADVDNALKDINDSLNGLDGKETNKDALQKLVNQAAEIQASKNYIDASADKKTAYDNALKKAQDILNDNEATQVAVDNAVKELTAAQDGLDGETNNEKPVVDKTDLKNILEQAEKAKETDKYFNATTEKQDSLNKAIDAGNKVLGNDAATADDVKTAIDDINKALENLDGQATDKTKLNDALTDAKKTQASDKYKNSSKDTKDALQKAIDNGTKVSEDPNAKQADVDKAVDDINNAQNALDGKATDKADLNKALEEAKNAKATDKYLNASKEKKDALDNAIDKAKEVLDDPNASQDDVKNAITGLTDAINNLDGQATPEQQVDKSKLQDAIKDAETAKNTDKYKNATTEKQNDLDKAINNAKTIVDDANAKQDDVDKATDALNKATNNLDGTQTDKSKLNDAIKDAEKVKETDQYKNADKDRQDAYNKALEDAKKVAEDPNASQADVDNALNNLNQAKDNLNGKTNEPNKPEKVINWTALDNAIKRYETMKANGDFEKASEKQLAEANKAYENAIAVRKQNDVDQNYVDLTTQVLNNALDVIQKEVDDLETKNQQELDKYKEEAKKQIDKMDYLDDKTKDAYKKQIDNAKTKEEIDRILAEANKENLAKAKAGAEKQINDLTGLTDAEKQAFLDRIKNAKDIAELDAILAEARAKNEANKAKTTNDEKATLPKTGQEESLLALATLGTVAGLVATKRKRD